MSSTLPLLLSLADELESLTTQTYPDDFGLGFYPHRHYNRNASTPSIQLSLPAHNFLERPARTRRKSYDTKSNSVIDGIGGINSGNSSRYHHHRNGFQVCMDVQDFKHCDLSVKTTEDTIVVEGKHDEREDEHGVISRQFTRKYPLPEGCDTNEVVSTLSSDGILTIKVPPNYNKYCERNERTIEIQQTGKVHPGNDDDDDNGEYNNGDNNSNGHHNSDKMNNTPHNDSSDDDDQDKIRKCKD